MSELIGLTGCLESIVGEGGGSAGPPEVVVVKTQYRHMKNFNYLVVDRASRQAIVVDPSWEMDKIEASIAEHRAILCGVLITHSHPDHIHLAEAVADRYECPIWMSHAEIEFSRYESKWLVGRDEAPWQVGALKIEPLWTPGHTPGCFCYTVGGNLFTGDVLFYEGCGMCPGLEAAHAMFDSLNKLKRIVGPGTLVFPGHSYGMPPGQPFSQLLRDNIYLQIPNKESFAAFRLRKMRHVGSIFGQ
jgi:hydroxyacylglutathione hydrolase